MRGEALSALDSTVAAGEEYTRAFDLDSLSEEIMKEATYGMVAARHHDQAVAMARRFQRAKPGSFEGYRAEVAAHLVWGDCSSALPVLEHARTIGDSDVYDAVGELHCQGHDAAARRVIAAAIHASESNRSYLRAGTVARMYALIGDRDEAFAWLERAFDAREATLANLPYSPRWDFLRPDPRFADLVRRVRRLPEEAH
jgi:predicted deacylase